MTSVGEYNGMPNAALFAGVYNGCGHTINVNIDSSEDNSLFGSVTGVVMNVGTTGTVKGATRPSGISRAVRDNGIVVNCWSSCDIVSDADASGIVRSNYNMVVNCLFTGTLSGTAEFNTCYVQPTGKAFNNYAVGEESYAVANETIVTKEELSSDEIVSALNDARTKAGDISGIAASLLCKWTLSADGVPVLTAE